MIHSCDISLSDFTYVILILSTLFITLLLFIIIIYYLFIIYYLLLSTLVLDFNKGYVRGQPSIPLINLGRKWMLK